MLTRILLRTIVFLLPTQLGLHFWPVFSRVGGIRIDYLSPTLYLVDLFIGAFVLLNYQSLILHLRKHLRFLFLFFLVLLLNLFFAVSPLNTLFWWLRTIFYLLFFQVLLITRFSWHDVQKPLLYSSILVLGLQIVQTFQQSSIGGIFTWLGERQYSASTPGLARINLLGLDLVRAPSIFSHPNSLSGYMLVVYLLFTQNNSPLRYRLIPFLSILFTLSKTALISLLLLLFGFPPLFFLVLSFSITIALPFLNHLSLTWQPLSSRIFVYPYLFKIFPHHFLTGTGLGGFIPAMGKVFPGSHLVSENLQPVHNLFFLYFSELGLLGGLPFFISSFIRKLKVLLLKPEIRLLLALILFTGALDHYSWTLPQNKLILLIALSVML